MKVRVKKDEPIDKALRRFKKKCEKAGLAKDIRRQQHFMKPSERRRKKRRRTE